MKKYLLWVCLIFTGCAIAVENDSANRAALPHGELTKIKQVQMGMSLNDVKSIMGDQVITGYTIDKEKDVVTPITMNSPYRTEVFEAAGKKYTALYYFTDVKKADGIVADDELAILVFEDNKLIGKGNDFLFRLKTNQ